jgi:hypothetical protein
METTMLYDRKSVIRLTLIFGVAAASYATAGIAATHARDHLLARAKMLHDLRHQAVGAEPVASLTASPVVGL